MKENLLKIKQQIEHSCNKVGRSIDEVSIIAVTKYVSVKTAKAALEAGIQHLGENREEGITSKTSEIGQNPTWHFIGTLQSRKVKSILNEIDYIHSLDRISLAKEINKRSQKPFRCFVQVNASGEESKHGLAPEETIPFIEKLVQFDNIEVVGLMTMAPFTANEERIRSTFAKTRELRDKIQEKKLKHAPCTELSMGMSNDFQLAIEEGATFIRIGTSLVGKEF